MTPKWLRLGFDAKPRALAPCQRDRRVAGLAPTKPNASSEPNGFCGGGGELCHRWGPPRPDSLAHSRVFLGTDISRTCSWGRELITFLILFSFQQSDDTAQVSPGEQAGMSSDILTVSAALLCWITLTRPDTSQRCYLLWNLHPRSWPSSLIYHMKKSDGWVQLVQQSVCLHTQCALILWFSELHLHMDGSDTTLYFA